MSQQLLNLSPDLKRLRDEGYEIEVSGGYLIAHHIPYVNSKGEIKFGILVSELNLSGNRTVKPNNHVIHFVGEHPCNKDGSIITAIQHSASNLSVSNGIVTNFSFSNKPITGYEDYHHKISRYADIISAPAKSINDSVTEKTFRAIPDVSSDSPFNYIDTNSSRAKINQINERFEGQKIAIIGLGGTGSYILDLVAKTPVKEIHIFDGDEFLQHNAFRSPGAPSLEVLDLQMKKVNYFKEVYSKIHKHIFVYPEYVTEQNIGLLKQMNYVFICIDRNSAREIIIDKLLQMDIPFIDVGLGVNSVDDKLMGTLRVTTGTSLKQDHLKSRIPSGDNDDNEYSTNIQIADLNSLNSVLAVIKWKKLSGFYHDFEKEHHSTYSINVSQLLNDDLTA